MQNKIQDGRVLDITLAADVKGGDVVALGNICGVAVTDGTTGQTIAVEVEGVFDLPAVSGTAFIVGDALYWNGTAATKTATGNPPLGLAVQAKTTGSTTARVRLGLGALKA